MSLFVVLLYCQTQLLLFLFFCRGWLYFLACEVVYSCIKCALWRSLHPCHSQPFRRVCLPECPVVAGVQCCSLRCCGRTPAMGHPAQASMYGTGYRNKPFDYKKIRFRSRSISVSAYRGCTRASGLRFGPWCGAASVLLQIGWATSALQFLDLVAVIQRYFNTIKQGGELLTPTDWLYIVEYSTCSDAAKLSVLRA